MANFDINVFIIARENSYKIGRAPYGVLTTPAGHRTTSYGARPGIGRCLHIKTPAGARTTCDHSSEIS